MNMNPDFNDRDFSDKELFDAFGAGGTPIEPSAAHVNALRMKLREKTKRCGKRLDSDSVPFTSVVRTNNRAKRFSQMVAIAAILLAVILASRLFVGTAAASLKSALDATRQSVWIHASTTVKRVDGAVELESWCSPVRRVSAFRSSQLLHFIDYVEGIQSSYSDKTDTVFRWRADPSGEEIGRTFMNALLANGDLGSSFPMHLVSSVKRMKVESQSKEQVRYSFDLKLKAMPKVGWETIVTVEPDTGRMVSWEESHSDGTRVLTRFDYPALGPSDIYALGAKPEAKVVDRVASSDIVALAKEFQDQVYRFDDYEALVIDLAETKQGVIVDKPLLRLIRKKANHFSVDLLSSTDASLSVPNDVDMVWWKSHRDRFGSVTLAKCDGETCTLYPYQPAQPTHYPDLQPIKELTSMPVISVKTSRGKTTIPIWPGLWPEYACRPFLVTSDPTVRFEIDPEGTDGPENTLRIRLIAPDSPFSKERASYWLSLDPHGCVVKSLLFQPSFERIGMGAEEKMTTNEFSHFAFSAKGIAFATQKISSEQNSSVRIKRRFLVDFDSF